MGQAQRRESLEIHNQPVFRMVLIEAFSAMLLEGAMPREDITGKTIIIKVLHFEQIIEAGLAHRMHL